MEGTGVIDRFLDVFTRYIDSGFGLLGAEVAFLAATLIVIDVTLAALFWAWGADDDIIARLVKKTLFVGVFAYIIGNWNTLARIVFESFAGLGILAAGSQITAAELLQPGRIAQVGIDAGRPILEAVADLTGPVAFFQNFIPITVSLFAWAIVLLSFFILAIQLFVTLIEFKLTTLAGFILVPFGLFGKTAFLAERVLGNIVSSGIKVLVLAVIVGIGSTLFAEFTQGFSSAEPTIDDAMAIVLAALALLGLGIFGPGIANGLISGGPQLGAGSAVATGLVAGGGAVAAGAGAGMVTGAAGRAAVGTARAGATMAGGASAAWQQGGASGVAKATGAAAISPLRRAASDLGNRFRAGGAAASANALGSGSIARGSAGEPAWARRMKHGQHFSQGVSTAGHAVHSGDRGGAGSTIDLKEDR